LVGLTGESATAGAAAAAAKTLLTVDDAGEND
jgi:hypothetical protein